MAEHTTTTTATAAPSVDPALAEDGVLDIVGVGGAARRARWFAVVIAVFVVAELLARVVTAAVPEEVRWYDAAMQLRVEMMDDLAAAGSEEPVDVVFAGTSSAWQAMVPDHFESADPGGRTAFNVGLDGAVPSVTAPWLLDHVVPRLQPDVVVWGLTPLDLSDGFGGQPAAAYEEAIAARTDWLAEVDHAVSRWSTLVRSRRMLRNPSGLFGAEADQRNRDIERAASVTGPDGERLDFDPDLSDELRRATQARFEGFAVDDRDRSLIVDTIDRLQGRGIEVVLIELPMPQRLRDLMPDPIGDSQLVSDEIARIASETGVGFVGMPRALNDLDFVDYGHVSPDGARQTSEWVAAALETLGSLEGGTCADLGLVDELGFAIPVQVCAPG